MLEDWLQNFRRSKHYYPTVLLVIMLLGVTLRLVNFTSEPLWYDEIFGIQLAYYGESIAEIVEYSKETFYTPLYYIGLRGWLHLFDNGPFFSRALSLIFSLASIGLIYAFVVRLFDKKTAVIATLLMAIAPLQVEFGQEARPYAIFSFIALLSMYFFWQFLINTKDKKGLIVITSLNVIGLYLHYDYFILIAAQIGIILILRTMPQYNGNPRELFVNGFIWWSIQGLLFLPWFIYAMLPSLTGVEYALSQSAPDILNIFLQGDLWINVVDSQERFQALMTFIGQIFVIGVLALGMLRFYKKIKESKKFDEETLAIFFLLAWYFFSLAFYFVSPLSAQYTPNWQRHIIIFSPPLLILIAYGMQRFSTIFVKNIVLGVIVLSALIPLIMVIGNDADWSKNHNVEPLRYIETHEKSGDYIMIPGSLWEVFFLYHFEGESKIGGFLPKRGFNSVEDRKHYLLPAIDEARYAYAAIPEDDFVGVGELEEILEPYKRVWLIYGSGVDPIFNWFIENWNFVDCPEDHCPNIYLFERPI